MSMIHKNHHQNVKKNAIPSGLFKYHINDSRKILELFSNYTSKREFIDVTITSPPYHDIKSYGIENQLGYGQNYESYLSDVRLIFKDIYDLTKKTGSLWIIIDAFSKNREIIPLPFELAAQLKKDKWILKEILIWKKDKTVPWSKNGQMRNIFEYILFFVKSNNFKFYQDRIREPDIENLKEWWIKYPERYNPNGKLPTNIWEYPIPVQGSWGDKKINHYNPLPIGLIRRILLLTTNKRSIVLDPFAGTGTILAVSTGMNRNSIGIDLNERYQKEYYSSVLNVILKELKNNDDKYKNIKKLQNVFSKKIINLRIIKYSIELIKVLKKEDILSKYDLNKLNSIFCFKRKIKKLMPNKYNFKTYVGREKIFLIFNDKIPDVNINDFGYIFKRKPLSKYQLFSEVTFAIHDNAINFILKEYQKPYFWLYTKGTRHKYKDKITLKKWHLLSKKEIWKEYFYDFIPPLLSNIKVNEKITHTWYSEKEKIKNIENKFNELISITKGNN